MLRTAALVLSLLGACVPAAQAQNVTLAGSMGARALLLIDGQPQTLAVGETARGVRLLQFADGVAQVERGGVVSTLRIGGAPARLAPGTASTGDGGAIVLPAGPGGHFVAQGSINGKAVQFLVDTGATLVAISQAEADRLGLDYRGGPRGTTVTANGPVQVHGVTLNAVRIGDVSVSNVAAVVVPSPMPYILLGNSYLTRFQMRRENDVMRLDLRR